MDQNTFHRAQYTRRCRSSLYKVAWLVLCFGVSACDSNAFWNASIERNGAAISNAGVREALSSGKTIGFVLGNLDLLYQSQHGKAGCPDGFVHTNRENWEVQFPTQAARQAHLNRCGEIQNRGPNCENVWFNPEVIKDPLPFREVKGKVSYGLNLDGVQDGRETKDTCAHEEFISPSGEAGIDNQYYRFLGCEKTRYPEEQVRRGVANGLVYRLLLEINGVDDEHDDELVEVAMYRGRDPLIVDATGKPVPWQSQRIDEGPRKLIFRARGRILNGVLITEPTDVMWASIGWEESLLIRGMNLRLRLTPTGAEGVRVGYVDVEQLWQGYSRYAASQGTLFGASGPSARAALHRLADGYKDPQTGACTALSSAQNFEFSRAYLIHPANEKNR